MNNIAENTLEYYTSEDFNSDYFMHLLEDMSTARHNLEEAIKDYVNDLNWPMIGETRTTRITEVWQTKDLDRIIEYICDNIEDFSSDFSNYWIGHRCIDSISFGEQEEQLTDIYNHETGKTFALEEMQKQFEEAGFYVNGEYAYYDMRGEGIKVDFIPELIPFMDELLTKYTKPIGQVQF